MRTSRFMLVPVAAAAATMFIGTEAQAVGDGLLVVNLTNINSVDGYNDTTPGNVNLDFFIGIGSKVTGVGWENVSLTEVATATYGSEAKITINDGDFDFAEYIDVTIFDGVAGFTGTIGPETQAIQKIDTDTANFNLSTDADTNNGIFANAAGNIRLHFWDSFQDATNGVDARWAGGNLLIQYQTVPAPGALALLGLAGLAGARRRRA